jgi:chromosome segregation ATPase
MHKYISTIDTITSQYDTTVQKMEIDMSTLVGNIKTLKTNKQEQNDELKRVTLEKDEVARLEGLRREFQREGYEEKMRVCNLALETEKKTSTRFEDDYGECKILLTRTKERVTKLQADLKDAKRTSEHKDYRIIEERRNAESMYRENDELKEANLKLRTSVKTNESLRKQLANKTKSRTIGEEDRRIKSPGEGDFGRRTKWNSDDDDDVDAGAASGGGSGVGGSGGRGSGGRGSGVGGSAKKSVFDIF